MSRIAIRWIVIAVVVAAVTGLVALLFLPRPVAVDTARAVVGPIAETVQD